jgi:putative transposase
MNTKDTGNLIENPRQVTENVLTTLVREGARKMLVEALNHEIESFISEYRDLTLSDGKARIVRNGYLPQRDIQTGAGLIEINVPRIRDRGKSAKETIRFTSSIIPKYLRRSRDIEEFIPLLYLNGISTGDFAETLKPLFGKVAKNLSPNVVSRLKTIWVNEHESWQKRSLEDKRYVYWWADGIHLKPRMEDKQCLLVIIGVLPTGEKELLAMHPGFRESKDSWLEMLNDIKKRGLEMGPKLAIGDGAMGFWGALNEAFPNTRHQRCWFHKMGNVLDKLPKSQHNQAKKNLQNIWMAATRQEAYKEFDYFIKVYSRKYPKASECLKKDKEALLAFYDFPSEHWQHIRTTNPIESTFSIVRHRTVKGKNCYSSATLIAMVFKLCRSAEKRWYKLRGFNRLGDVIKGVKFIDGISENELRNNCKNGVQENVA